MIEHHRLAGLQVGRDGGEWNGERAEIPDRVCRPGEAGEELRDALTRDDALRQFDPAAMNRQREQIVVLGELSFDREIATIDRVGEQTVPVLRGHDGVELSGRVAHGIQAPHDAAHARAGDHVHRNPCLLEHLQHADVGEPARRTAREGDTDPLGAGSAQR